MGPVCGMMPGVSPSVTRSTPTGVPLGRHAVKPLPFDPKKLRGLSERLIVSHHDNNYAGAIRSLNKVEEELALVTADTPGFIIGGLKERELTCGSFARWEESFRATGMSLAGGSGWTILDFNFHAGDLRTYWSGNHTQALASGIPLLVMDMYEHAYHIDYGAAAAKYVDAFFQNINWEEVNRRLERARKAATVLTA